MNPFAREILPNFADSFFIARDENIITLLHVCPHPLEKLDIGFLKQELPINSRRGEELHRRILVWIHRAAHRIESLSAEQDLPRFRSA